MLNIVPGADDAAAAGNDDDDEVVLVAEELEADVLDELLQAAPTSTMPASATTTVHRRGTRCRKSVTRNLLQSLDRYTAVVRTNTTDGLPLINDAVRREPRDDV